VPSDSALNDIFGKEAIHNGKSRAVAPYRSRATAKKSVAVITAVAAISTGSALATIACHGLVSVESTLRNGRLNAGVKMDRSAKARSDLSAHRNCVLVRRSMCLPQM
jgi:hypothetical protein